MVDKKFTINVKELKKNMNLPIKILFFVPIEFCIRILNYIYIALITTYFRLGLKPNIYIQKINFHTDIDIVFANKETDNDDLNVSDNEDDDQESDTLQSDISECNVQKSVVQESDNQESDNKESDNKESDNKESVNQESDNKESVNQESDKQESDKQESDKQEELD